MVLPSMSMMFPPLDVLDAVLGLDNVFSDSDVSLLALSLTLEVK